MEARTLVAIEIASSKIKGAVATAEPDGSLRVIAVEELRPINIVRHGRVQNIREVSAAVNEIIRKLENNPAVYPRRVQSVALGTGGRSLCGIPASAYLQFPHDIEITDKTVERLKTEVAKDFAGNKDIDEIIPRNFYINNSSVQVSTAVGTLAHSLRGDFLMLTSDKTNRENIARIKFDTVGSGSVDYILRPLALADAVLDDDERQLGCVLVDFGAETTTVSVYKNGTLTFLRTLPMGSRLITMDLMSGLTLTEAAAEDFKLTLGSLGENTSDAANAAEVNNYVRARAGEIAANIVNQIEISGVGTENLGAGIVLVGGGARLPEFGSLLASQSHLNVRAGKLPEGVEFADRAKASTDNIDVVALLLAMEHRDLGDSLSTLPAAVKADVSVDLEPLDDELEDIPADIRTEPKADKRAESRPAARTARKAEPVPASIHVDDEEDFDSQEDDDEYLLMDDDNVAAARAKAREKARRERERREAREAERRRSRGIMPPDEGEDETDDTTTPDEPTTGGGRHPEGGTDRDHGFLDKFKEKLASFFASTGEPDMDDEDDDK